MKAVVAGLLLFGSTGVFAAVPDPRDSIILESKVVMPGFHPGATADTAAYLYVRMSITNKDTLSNITFPVEIKSISGGAFTRVAYPRNSNGTCNKLTSTLNGAKTAALNRINSASPDSAIWSNFYDPIDPITTSEKPNLVRKGFWELKFDTVDAAAGMIEIDSIKILASTVQFVNLNAQKVDVNFVKSVIMVGCNPPPAPTIDCSPGQFNVLYGRPFSFDFNATGGHPVFSVVSGPGTIGRNTGLYSFSGTCPTASIPVTIRVEDSLFANCQSAPSECSFMLNVVDNPPLCFPDMPTLSVPHGTLAANRFNASDPDAGDTIFFSMLQGPGTVNSSGEWSYQTSCADVGFRNVFVRAADGFDSCIPGPSSADSSGCSFLFSVTNAAPTISGCPTGVENAQPNVSYSLQLASGDIDTADAGQLTFSLVYGPAGLTLSPGGLVEWMPAAEQTGTQYASIRVTDPCGKFTRCGISFNGLRGDLNLDGSLTSSDVVLLLNHVFLGTIPSSGPGGCDLNCDGQGAPNDVVILLNAVFVGDPFPC